MAILLSLTPDEANAYSSAEHDCFVTLLREGIDRLPDEGPTAELLALTDDLGGEIRPSHPRIVEHEQAVAACLADVGHPYTTLQEVTNLLHSEILAIDATLSASPERVHLTEGELAALPPQPLPDNLLTQLADLQQREFSLAVAAWDCGSSEATDWELIKQIQRDEKREFVESHRQELEPYRRST
jgi:hypothetical protein